MPAPSPTLCFTCGLAVSEPPRLNALPDGTFCPACRDRLLDALPPALPSEAARAAQASPRAEALEATQEWTSPPGEERV